MIQLTADQITKALQRIRVGLAQYLWIQTEVKKRDVSVDREFQRRFNHFYRIRRGKEWQGQFYSLLEERKNKSIRFETILSELLDRTGRLESSFASKLKATIDPGSPVIDSVVLRKLGLRLPYWNQRDRAASIAIIYHTLETEYVQFLQTTLGRRLVSEFSRTYPDANVTETKMLDFVLWQTRA